MRVSERVVSRGCSAVADWSAEKTQPGLTARGL